MPASFYAIVDVFGVVNGLINTGGVELHVFASPIKKNYDAAVLACHF